MSATQGDADLIPVSVRLGTVVPPEDPEDWGRPMTWIAAAGMLLAPVFALMWFSAARPLQSDAPFSGTYLLSVAVTIGAVLTGSTQVGGLRAFIGTLGAALFAALATLAIGAILAGGRQLDASTPTLAHAFGAGLAGLAGAVAAGMLAWPLARLSSRTPRVIAPGAVGICVAVLTLALVFAPPR